MSGRQRVLGFETPGAGVDELFRGIHSCAGQAWLQASELSSRVAAAASPSQVIHSDRLAVDKRSRTMLFILFM
jgi:hypothetical protein